MAFSKIPSKDLYAELLKAGVPELPEGFYYKFHIAPYQSKYQYIISTEEKASSRALHCAIRKKHLGGLFFSQINQWYMPYRDMANSYSETNDILVSQGVLDRQQLDGTYQLPHLAHLAKTTYRDFKKKQQRKSVPSHAPSIARFLNRRIP